MSIKRHIFISSPADRHLDERRYKIKWAIVGEIEKLGYETSAFGTHEGGRGLASGRAWNADRVNEVMCRCVGAAVLGLSIGVGTIVDEPRPISISSEYCHFEAGLARAYGIPVLSILEGGVREKAFFNRYADVEFYSIPAGADETSVGEPRFQTYLAGWKSKLANRRDIFLGYSSGAAGVASRVRRYLEENLQVSVLDWADGLAPGGDILEEIKNAASNCRAGVFLFTKDDRLAAAAGDAAAPRDNVVFEAGFFARAKGTGGVLIIREEGSKFPADLGGKIFASLADRENIGPVEESIRRFVERL
jgi:hypothetical protein